MADSNEAPRKTLDEIRSELAAEYPVASQTEEDPIGASDDAVIAVEQVRSAGRHRERRRRYAMAAVFVGITASLLLVAGHALRREPAPLNRRASTPDLSAPSAAPAPAVRQPAVPQPAAPVLPAAVVELDRQLKALSRDVRALTQRLERSDTRIRGIESHMQGMQSTMRRLVDDAAAASAASPAERTASAPPRTITTPAGGVAVAPTTPLTASASERWIPPRPLVPEDATAPREIPAAKEIVAPAAVSPPAATPREVAETAGSKAPTTLRRKLSAEWHTIKEGFAGAGDDFKAALRELGRKFTRE